MKKFKNKIFLIGGASAVTKSSLSFELMKKHKIIHKLSKNDIFVFWVWEYLSFFGTSSSRHNYLPFLAPYFERLCFLLATPEVSNAPLTV